VAAEGRSGGTQRSADRLLHPASLVVHVANGLKPWLIPLALVLVFSKGERWEFWFMLWLVPSTAYQALRYWRLRWRLDPDELVVREGVFFRNERHVPFERIQNIDLVQGPLERWLALASVRIETATGSEPEAELSSVRLCEVDEIRARVFAGRGRAAVAESHAAAPWTESGATVAPEAHGAPSPAPVSLARLGLRELALLGLSSQRGFVLILSGLWFGRELGPFGDVSQAELRPWFDLLPAHRWAIAVLVLLGVALLLAGALSIAWTVLRFHGFELLRAGEDLRWSAGLLTRRAATIPRQRIQLVSAQAGLLQRWLGGVCVRIETGAGTAEESETRQARRWFVPWLASEELAPLLSEIDPGLDLAAVPWQPPAPGFRRRMVKKAILSGALAGVAGLALVRPWGALAFLLLPLFVALALREARSLAWARTSMGLAFQSGALRHRRSFVRSARLQSVSVKESPFDRRHGMASLCLDTAGAGPAQHKVHVPYLRKEVAVALARELAAEAELRGFEW
jgi:putative membrane protein